MYTYVYIYVYIYIYMCIYTLCRYTPVQASSLPRPSRSPEWGTPNPPPEDHPRRSHCIVCFQTWLLKACNNSLKRLLRKWFRKLFT